MRVMTSNLHQTPDERIFVGVNWMVNCTQGWHRALQKNDLKRPKNDQYGLFLQNDLKL